MDHPTRILIPMLTLAVLMAACAPEPGPPTGPTTVALDMIDHDVDLVWAITRDHEMPCGGDEVGGGAVTGTVTFATLGAFALDLSAAWDIEARIADPDQAEFEPEGPAGGPFAPVFGPDGHPYAFEYDPFTQSCDPTVTATGEIVFTGDGGDTITAVITGGETHRLDFVVEGDGIETFAIAEITGGTGAYAGASGEFVIHTIAQAVSFTEFEVNLVEVLDGGTITY